MTIGLLANFESDCLAYREDFLPVYEADTLLNRLWDELDWKHQAIRIYGKRVMQPRLTAWFGDPEAIYQYSGLEMKPELWHESLRKLKATIECDLGPPFNSVLANAYRNGDDSMGWHSDNEPELGEKPTIASLTLGAERRFLLRRGRGGRSSSVILGHGSLLIMKNDCQAIYQHSLPKSKSVTGLRINLTFRNISPLPGRS